MTQSLTMERHGDARAAKTPLQWEKQHKKLWNGFILGEHKRREHLEGGLAVTALAPAPPLLDVHQCVAVLEWRYGGASGGAYI